MTDLVPVTPIVPSAVQTLREQIAAADTQRQALVEAGDLDALAAGLAQLRQITADMRLLAQAVEDDVVSLMPDKRYTLQGVGTLERRKGTDRRQWDSLELARLLVLAELVDPATGEIDRTGDPVEVVGRVVAALVACAPFTSSMGWRVTALRDRGINPDEWATTTPGRTTVQIHGEQEQP